MLDGSDARALIEASLYFHELFKRTIVTSTTPLGVTRTQMDLLISLYLNGPCSMSTLSRSAGMAPEQATRAMKGLRERGLVTTERDEQNRRMVIARLSEKGISALETHEQRLNSSLEASLEGLSREEFDQLVQGSQLVASLLKKTGVGHSVATPERVDEP